MTRINLTTEEQKELSEIVSKILARGIQGLNSIELQRRTELLMKKYPDEYEDMI